MPAPASASASPAPDTPPTAAQLHHSAAPHGARLLCRWHVQRADLAADGLRAHEPPTFEAMLEAVRDLRVIVVGYESVLAELVPGVLARRLAALARILASPEGHTEPFAAQRVRERWTRLALPVRPALASWRERHSLDGSRRSTPFAAAAAAAVQRAADRASRRAASPGEDGARAVAVAAAALRTLLEPLAALSAGGAALRHQLHADGPTLASWRDPDVRSSRLADIAAVTESWRSFQDPRPLEFRERGDGEPDRPLPVEIERKWLLSSLPPHARTAPVTDLAQGYLPGESLVERIRRRTTGTDVQWLRTVKLGQGMARIEVEEATTPDLGEALFALTAGRRVTKRRYTVTEGAHHWEIDEFTDRALVLAELELERVDAVVDLPPWLAPHVVREVTGEREFTNWQLAR